MLPFGFKLFPQFLCLEITYLFPVPTVFPFPECHISRIILCSFTNLCLTLWDPIDCSLPDSSVHGISRQKYWSGLSFPSPGNLPDPGIKPVSSALAGVFFTTEPWGKSLCLLRITWNNNFFLNMASWERCGKTINSTFWATSPPTANYNSKPIVYVALQLKKSQAFSLKLLSLLWLPKVHFKT